MTLARVLTLDWSAAGAPKRGADSIWIGDTDADGTATHNLPTRAAALDWLERRIGGEAGAVLLACDFCFGLPAGGAQAVTGADDALALWDWLATRIEDGADNRNNYRAIAAEMNRRFGGDGPFWGNGAKEDIPDLPRRKPALPEGIAEFRKAELADQSAGQRPMSPWQLAGAGAVGAQSILGIAALERLRERLAASGKRVAVWPFEPVDGADVIFAEAYFSLLAAEVAAEVKGGAVRDEAQVRLHGQAFYELAATCRLEGLLRPDAPAETLRSEGWYLGAGQADIVRRALPAGLTPPRLRNDCFAMPQGVNWVPVDDALKALDAALVPLVTTTTRKTHDALGAILAKDTIARRSNPPRPNSAVDGYGFAHAATGSGVQTLPLVTGRAAAGQPFDGAVPSGMAVRILTGAILPEGVDTVVLEEDCATDGARVSFDGPVKAGANTRKAGEDVAEGQPALSRGHKLRAPDLALLSALGIGEVEVYRQLRVGVLSTGDEIVSRPDLPAEPHQIYDANRPMLLSLAAGWGYEAVNLGHVKDRPAQIAKKLDAAAAKVDVILTSGGASAGDEDHVSRLLRERGTLSSWRIALKPGRPLALALWNGVPVLGLPGNPVAALVCALIFGRPAFSKLAGSGWIAPQGFTVPAAFEKAKKPGRREFLRARLNADGAAEVFASEGSGRISGLSWAEGLVELPDGAVKVKRGDPVRFLPYSGFGLT